MESISRISSALESARDLTLEAARDAAPRKSGRGVAMPAQQIKKLLDGRSERDVLDGLRRVIAMQYAQPPLPTLSFFPAVLKTLSNPYPSTRPLVYNYLLHHAEADPDTALLAVNTIQKSLGDSNPRIRAMALKTMSAIRVPVLSQIVSLAIKRGVSDLSPLVRKTAALACVKCVRLDSASLPQVEDYVKALIADRQYYVAGAAVQAFMDICPDRIDMIHPVYRRLCKMIVDMDEWGQLATLRLMTSYARQCFPKRVRQVRRADQSQDAKARSFYEDLDGEDKAVYEEAQVIDPDLERFLGAIRPLLQSRNSAVVLAVTKAYVYLSPEVHLPSAVGSLVALLRSPQDVQYIAFYNIVQIALTQPVLFVPYTRHFLLRSSDAPSIRQLKLEILTLTFPHTSKEYQDLVLAELEHFSHAQDAELVRDSVRAIGRCAQYSSGPTARRCLTLLLRQIHSPDANLVGEAIDVVRHLIQRNPTEHGKTIVRLAKNLDTLVSPMARASVVWLVGEYTADDTEGIAADVLRLLVRNFANEDNEVKAQIVLLAAKVYLHFLNAQNAKTAALDALQSPTSLESNSEAAEGNNRDTQNSDHPIAILYAHTLLLARYTSSYDLRDRARTYRALLARASEGSTGGGKANTDLATLLLLQPKPIPLAPSPGEARQAFTLGSASLVVGEKCGSDAVGVPDWVVEGKEPDPRLRDGGDDEVIGAGSENKRSAGQQLDDALSRSRNSATATGQGAVSVGVGRSSRKEKTLDDWLDEESSSEEEDSEESDSEEEDDESEDDDDEEESEEDDDEDDDDEDEDEDDDEKNEKARLVR